MGAMMGSTMGAWILLWILLGLAVAVTVGVVVARVLGAGRKADPPQIPRAESPAVREAKDALRLRYANGEISREDYLQGKVELED
jgi:putative membrane protein